MINDSDITVRRENDGDRWYYIGEYQGKEIASGNTREQAAQRVKAFLVKNEWQAFHNELSREIAPTDANFENSEIAFLCRD